MPSLSRNRPLSALEILAHVRAMPMPAGHSLNITFDCQGPMLSLELFGPGGTGASDLARIGVASADSLDRTVARLLHDAQAAAPSDVVRVLAFSAN